MNKLFVPTLIVILIFAGALIFAAKTISTAAFDVGHAQVTVESPPPAPTTEAAPCAEDN